MKKIDFLKIFFSVVLVLCFGCILLFNKIDGSRKNTVTVKELYEEENNKEGVDNITIPDENNFEVVSDEKIKELLSGKTGVLYLGNPSSNESRKWISLVSEVSLDYDTKVYYENLKDVDRTVISELMSKVNCSTEEEFYLFFIKNGEIKEVIHENKETKEEELVWLQEGFNTLAETCDDAC